MRRLVYSPNVHVFVKTDVGVFDLSQYVVSCDVSRRINQISSASVTINNPKVRDPQVPNRMMFTDWQYTAKDGGVTYGPLFHPMDPITITMTRLQGFPIQVFTGYLDKTPYVQIKPGTATLTASCTLKRLQYTFWDPGLFYVRDFLQAYGWIITPEGGLSALPTLEQKSLQANGNVLSDSGFADLLYGVLHYIGGWSYDSIYIEPMNPEIVKLVMNLFPKLLQENKQVEQVFESQLAAMIGLDTKGGGDPSGTNVGPDPSAPASGGGGGSGGSGGGPSAGPSIDPGAVTKSGQTISGGVSWFGGPNDSTDSGHTANGGTTATPGIAVFNQTTLGGYWKVTLPNGKVAILQQTDIGPAPWTHRVVDITYSALPKLGYTESNFPTSPPGTATVTAVYLGKTRPAGVIT